MGLFASLKNTFTGNSPAGAKRTSDGRYTYGAAGKNPRNLKPPVLGGRRSQPSPRFSDEPSQRDTITSALAAYESRTVAVPTVQPGVSYDFTGAEKTNAHGITLKQIRATKSNTHHQVKKGDLGGWIAPAWTGASVVATMKPTLSLTHHGVSSFSVQ